MGNQSNGKDIIANLFSKVKKQKADTASGSAFCISRSGFTCSRRSSPVRLIRTSVPHWLHDNKSVMPSARSARSTARRYGCSPSARCDPSKCRLFDAPCCPASVRRHLSLRSYVALPLPPATLRHYTPRQTRTPRYTRPLFGVVPSPSYGIASLNIAPLSFADKFTRAWARRCRVALSPSAPLHPPQLRRFAPITAHFQKDSRTARRCSARSPEPPGATQKNKAALSPAAWHPPIPCPCRLVGWSPPALASAAMCVYPLLGERA